MKILSDEPLRMRVFPRVEHLKLCQCPLVKGVDWAPLGHRPRLDANLQPDFPADPFYAMNPLLPNLVIVSSRWKRLARKLREFLCTAQ